jgi:hypothetical protein
LKHILTVWVLLMLVAFNAGICCLPLWLQVAVDHSCCKHSSKTQQCEPTKLEFERAEHLPVTPAVAALASPVMDLAVVAVMTPVSASGDSCLSHESSPPAVLRV